MGKYTRLPMDPAKRKRPEEIAAIPKDATYQKLTLQDPAKNNWFDMMDARLLCYLNGFTLVRPASLWDRVWLHRGGWRFLGFGTREGWRGALPLYTRGGHVAYPQGYEGRLEPSSN